MSTVAEIESAIGHLTPQEVEELAAWLDEYRQMIRASAEVFSLYDGEIEADLRQTQHDLATGNRDTGNREAFILLSALCPQTRASGEATLNANSEPLS